MRNRGLDSFKADDYGDTVTVHRTIKDDGSTAYKIKAADGELQLDTSALYCNTIE